MPVMLERWNDDKMDGLAAKVDDFGVQLREQRQEMNELRKAQRDETRELRQEMKDLGQEMRQEMKDLGQEMRHEMKDLQKEMKAGFERVDGRFERVERMMTQAAIALSGSMILGFATVLATQL